MEREELRALAHEQLVKAVEALTDWLNNLYQDEDEIDNAIREGRY